MALETALADPPKDLRAWIWSLAPYGKRVLVAAAAAVMEPALEAYRSALVLDPPFADAIRDDEVLVQACEAVHAWLRDPATTRLEEIQPRLIELLERLAFMRNEWGGDTTLHERIRSLASCVGLTVEAALWTDDVARQLAQGDAREEASRIEAGPAHEAAEAVHRYVYWTHDPAVVTRIVTACSSVLG